MNRTGIVDGQWDNYGAFTEPGCGACLVSTGCGGKVESKIGLSMADGSDVEITEEAFAPSGCFKTTNPLGRRRRVARGRCSVGHQSSQSRGSSSKRASCCESCRESIIHQGAMVHGEKRKTSRAEQAGVFQARGAAVHYVALTGCRLNTYEVT
jgi:hypothetical protein